MATHSSVLAWRIPGTGQPGGLPSMGSHWVRHNWSDLAAAARKYSTILLLLLTYLSGLSLKKFFFRKHHPLFGTSNAISASVGSLNSFQQWHAHLLAPLEMVLSELESPVAAGPSLCFFVQVSVHFRVAKGPATVITQYHWTLDFAHRLLCY